MSLSVLLDTLRLGGVTLGLDAQGGLRVSAPRGALTGDLRERLLAHKQALLSWLRETSADDGAALPTCTPDPAAVYEPFALSDLQMGFYMADDPFMEFHVRPHYYIEKDLPGLDVARYEAAWNRALWRHRHELVAVRPDGRLQTVADPARLCVVVADLREAPHAQVQAALARTRDDMMRAELPIDRWPWLDLRVSLWREDGREHARIHYNHNNFFSDGYGTTRLLQEIEQCYADPALVLPPLALSFRDAALALEDLAAGAAGQRARRYWEERLPGLPDALPLPLRAGVPRRCRSRLQRREGFLDAAAWAAFKQHAQQAGLTPSSAVFAAYAEVLATWSHSDHFLLSNMMTRRLNLHPEMSAIVGNFASLYPLEIDLRGRSSFRDSAQRLQEQVIRDARHLQWGGMRVMQALNQRKASLGSAAVPYVVGSGLFMEGFERSDFSCLETSQVLMDHQFWELPDGRLYYVWDLLEEFFPAGMVDDMWGAYAQWLSQLAHDGAAWERQHVDLRPAWQAGLQRQAPVDAGAEPGATLCGLLAAVAQACPDATAVVDGGERCSQAQLAAAARRVAVALADAGLVPGERVAVVADRGAAWLAAVHGVLLAGGAYVPVDPALPPQRGTVMLADAGAHHVLCSARHAGRTWPPGVQAIQLEALMQADAPAAGALRRGRPAAAGDLAYVIYTSGSTGQPKGVMIDHRGVLNTVLDINQRFQVGPQDRLFGVSSIGFDLSVYDVFGAAAAGACVVYPQPQQALNPAHWLELMRAEAVTVWNSAPPLAVLLADLAESGQVSLPALRLVLLSGDWIPLDLPDRLRRVAPNARLVSLGGATEASIWSIVHEIGPPDPDWPSIPYGRPMRNQTWHVLDAQGHELPVWVPGDLYIGGVGLAQGYWNDPAKTTQAFITHPHSGERLYRTGDVGRWRPDGLIEFLGRRDAQVKIQGHRIELGEIEAALCSHPAVAAALVRVPGSGQGRGADANAQLEAHVVCRPGGNTDVAGLIAHLSASLPAYMVPRRMAFLPQLPLSANGKVDRRALPPIAAAPDLADGSPPVLRAPAGAVESRLLALWSQVLGRELTQVGNDFFAIGGQSFEAVRLVGLIQQAFGTRLSLGDLWQHRSVEQQAALVLAQGAPGTGPLRELSAHGAGLPLFLVHPAGGNVLCYRHLAAALRRPVHAFEAHGLAAPGTTVEALAARYRAALAEHCPEGPVLLGGWSSGGPIAFELAVQLRHLGREVAGLVILDSPAPAALAPITAQQLLPWFVEDLDLGPRAVALAATLPVPGATPARHRDTLLALAQALGTQGLHLPVSVDDLVDVYRTFEAIVCATAAYRAPVLDVNLLVLRATQGQVSEFARHPHAGEAAWGWQHHGCAALHAVAVAATHHTLLQPGAALECAGQIERWAEALHAPRAWTTPTATENCHVEP